MEDLHATIYHALGIPPDTAYVVERRPVYVTRDGEGQADQGAVRMNRREFLAAAAAAPIASPILLGTQDKAGTKAPVLGSGAYTYEAIHDWGTLPAEPQVGQHARRRRGLAGPHLRAPHRPRDERERRLDGRVRREGQVRPLVGQGVQGRRARPAHPEGRAATSSST